MSDVKLEPCPFCGGEAGVLMASDEADPSWRVWCLRPSAKCGVIGPAKETKPEAIAAWNRRPTPAPSQSFNDGLEEAARIAKNTLEEWANDLAATREQYIEAQTSGRFSGRKIPADMARAFARDFGERSKAVEDCARMVDTAIRARKT